MDSIGSHQVLSSHKSVAQIPWGVTNKIGRRTEVIHAIVEFTKAIRARTAHRRPGDDRLDQPAHRVQRNLRARTADALRTDQRALIQLLATIGDQSHTQDPVCGNRPPVVADLPSHVARNHRALAEAGQHEGRRRACLVHLPQLVFQPLEALVTGVVVGHLPLRVDVAELRGIRQRPHLHLLLGELLGQGAGDIQQQGPRVGARSQRIIVRLGFPRTRGRQHLYIRTPRRVLRFRARRCSGLARTGASRLIICE